MYTFGEQRKKPIENVIEIRTMYREQEICKNGGFNLKWFCFLDKLEERSFFGSNDSCLQLKVLSKERDYIYNSHYGEICQEIRKIFHKRMDGHWKELN